MINLIINNILVDMPDDVSVLFQRQRTDYTNPTIVRNSFTKTIRLPGTDNNNAIFGQLWKLDKTIDGRWDREFNPSVRNPFILTDAYSNLIEQGYVKLNSIEWDGNFYSYNVTLYGELGNLLYGLSYRIDEETQENYPLTLADLDLGFREFAINKELIEAAWGRLNDDYDYRGDEYAIFDTINFCVSYDGAPSAANFDAKKIWTSVDRMAAVIWKDSYYYANEFPSSIVDDGVTYRYISTMVSRMDPDDRYGLMELKKEISPLEARDLRSYLLRPVVNIKKVFDAIGEYISRNFDYTLDMSDEFFNTYEFKSTWMTLSMLYEINPDVETGTVFTNRQLFSNTSSLASYLISYCKTYGIYMDVDFAGKRLILTRLPRFFNSEKVNNLKVDLSRNIKITPLSFDKASYTFDYGDGEGEFLKKYKDTYGIQYGSKRVNTGYRFDASSAPYIDNNIFRAGVDSIDQSPYYRYPYAVREGILFDYPTGILDEANPPTYKLFDMESYSQLGDVKTVDGQMTPHWYPGIRNGDSSRAYNIPNSGYQFLASWWIGLRQGVWQDSYPKLQCHSEGNKAVDGKNILLKFSGFKRTSYGSVYNTEDRTYFVTETYNDYNIDASKVNYLLSDDYPYLKGVIGQNCYFDCPSPSESYGGYTYIKVINNLPVFSRCTYNYTRDYGNIPVMYVSGFDNYNIYGSTSSVSTTGYASYFSTTVSSSSGRQYPYFSYLGFDPNHRYFVAAAVRTSDAATIKTNNSYVYPDIIGSTRIDSRNLGYSDTVQLIASIVETGSTRPDSITPLSTNGVSGSVSFNTYYLIAFDLTELGLADNISTVEEAIQYFGLTDKKVGYLYHLTDTLDFGIPRELYVPSCTYEEGIGIFNNYWMKYISDVYSINTRVMECYCYLDNIDEVFREFYFYDNALWILSKIVDWDTKTHWCKGTFIKVNNSNNYTQE